ncbi:biotin/lipoyl-binding protein [Apirhabdus apintestini]|nr:biotin/lipoyl-binding protein [Enterobacteriaceae bacterium CA-0114]
MLLWAAFAPLDSGVNVPGIVIVTENRKAVQPLTSGKIIRLHVRDGQAVRQGETLIELDSRPLLALRENLHYQYLDALANLGRLQAEINDAASLSAFIDKRLSLDDSVAQALSQAQQKLLTSRRDAHLREGNAIQASIAGIAAQIAGARATIASNQQQVQLLNKRLLRVRPLVQEQFVAANRHLELERQFAQVSGALAQERQRLMALQQQKQEIEQTFSLRESEYRKMLYEQFIETSKLTQDLEQRLKSAEYDLENTKIISPASGIIVGLTVYTEGAIISAGQLLMEVVPQCQQRVKSDPLTVTTNGLILIHLAYSGLASAITPAFRFCFSR